MKKPPIPTTRATVSLIKVKEHNAFLRTPCVCIRSYPKSILRQYLILDTEHPDADSSCRAVQGVCLELLVGWGCGFQSCRGHEYVCLL